MTEFHILTSWNEIKEEIKAKLLKSYAPWDKKIKPHTSFMRRVETENKKEYEDINQRLNFHLYKNLNNQSAINTIKYIYYKIRSGIFVKIENNKLVAFIPFANKNFTNNWSNNVKLFNSNNIYEYQKLKYKYFKYPKKYIKNIKNWWANAYIVNNEIFENVWGQHSLLEYYNIIIETLNKHQVNDCIFIINKRDHPILDGRLYEPYKNFYPKKTKIEKENQYKNYIPILSPYSNKYYLDIPFIIPQDWQLANQDDTYYKIKNEIKWEDKIDTAFFRGSATGSMEYKYNQRLQISKLDYEWNKSKPNLLNAGIVSWNSRDKIDSDLQINFIKPIEMNKLGIYLKKKVPMNEQIKYKYILNIDGHSKPNRTSYLLQCGSLILMVESKYIIGDICWYTNLLKPNIHYIPIKYDLSDLEDKILWCRNNDDKCKIIVNNAKKLYNLYFNKKKILEYSAYLFNKIGNNFS